MLSMKKLMRSPMVQRIAAKIISLYLLFIKFSCRWSIKGLENIEPYWKTNKPMIVVFWHNRMAMAPFAWQSSQPFFMLISPHANGKLIAKVVEYFGIQSIYGSSSHNRGVQSLRSILKCLKKGYSVGITPDGPRGPCEILKDGVFMASYASQCDVVALSYATSNHYRFSSWDRFFFPLPFGKGRWVWSATVPSPRSMDQKQAFNEKVRLALASVTATSKC